MSAINSWSGRSKSLGLCWSSGPGSKQALCWQFTSRGLAVYHGCLSALKFEHREPSTPLVNIARFFSERIDSQSFTLEYSISTSLYELFVSKS